MAHKKIDEKQVRAMYCKDGMTQQAIADALGVSRATVSACLSGMDITRKDRREWVVIDGARWTIETDTGDTMTLKKVHG